MKVSWIFHGSIEEVEFASSTNFKYAFSTASMDAWTSFSSVLQSAFPPVSSVTFFHTFWWNMAFSYLKSRMLYGVADKKDRLNQESCNTSWPPFRIPEFCEGVRLHDYSLRGGVRLQDFRHEAPENGAEFAVLEFFFDFSKKLLLKSTAKSKNLGVWD